MRKRFRWTIWGLMVAVALSAVLTLFLRPHWPDLVARYDRWHRLRLVENELLRPITLSHPKGIPLNDLLSEIQRSTRSPSSPNGLGIYVDQIGLFEANSTLDTPVIVDARNSPLGPTLRSLLHPLDLDYSPSPEGFITITHRESMP
jgi:hypothetical protein